MGTREGCIGRRRLAAASRIAVAVALPALALGLAGCLPVSGGGSAAPAPTSSTAAPPDAAGSEAATLLSVIDGDTVETSAGTVRLIGIDTPEREECGYDEASNAIAQLLAAGDPIALELPAGQNDRDVHDRLLRYVSTGAGVDLGLMQVEAGNAVARYDSADGYPAHPREAAYRAAQRAVLGADGSVLTTSCQAAPPPAPPAAAAEQAWWGQYSSCAKLKRNTVGHPTGPFSRDDPAEAEIYDWFAYGTGNHGDGDGDGLACE